MLDVHDELGDVAAAEAAVIAKDTERGAIVDRLHDELRGGSPVSVHRVVSIH